VTRKEKIYRKLYQSIRKALRRSNIENIKYPIDFKEKRFLIQKNKNKIKLYPRFRTLSNIAISLLSYVMTVIILAFSISIIGVVLEAGSLIEISAMDNTYRPRNPGYVLVEEYWYLIFFLTFWIGIKIYKKLLQHFMKRRYGSVYPEFAELVRMVQLNLNSEVDLTKIKHLDMDTEADEVESILIEAENTLKKNYD